MTEPQFFTSSYSSNGGACIEVATNISSRGVVPVRDSKSTTGPILAVPVGAFASFVGGVKAGELSD